MWLTILSWFLRPVGKVLGAFVGFWLKNHSRHKSTLPDSMKKTRDTRAAMSEMRVLAGADRVVIFQLHNGGYFSNHNPQWRISCTDEVHGPGVLPAGSEVQALFASRVTEIVGHLFDPATPPPHTCPEDIGGRKVFTVDIASMPTSFAKMILVTQGVNTFIQLPLYDLQGMVFGYLALDYCNFGHPMTDPDFAPKLPQIVDYTNRIEFLINEHGAKPKR